MCKSLCTKLLGVFITTSSLVTADVVVEVPNDSWEYQFELAHALADRADLAIRQIISQTEGQSLTWDELQVAFNYRLAAADKFICEPSLNFEYGRATDLKAQNVLVSSLHLSRDWHRWNLTLIPLYEISWAPGEPAHQIGFDMTCSCQLSDKLALGMESYMRKPAFTKDADGGDTFVVPNFAVTSGSMYYTFGYALGLAHDSDEPHVRFLMGVAL